MNPKFRNGGQRIREEFCKVLRQEAGITAACDPAYDQYLETGCPEYMLGKQLDELLEDTDDYQELDAKKKSTVWGRCHADNRLSSMAGDDEYEDLEVQILASRINAPRMRGQLEEIIDSVIDQVKG